jgi:hypothetical protein
MRVLCALILALTCCAGQTKPISRAYSVKDDVEHRQFVLRYHNVTRRTLCLSYVTWPNEAGNIPMTDPPDIYVSIRDQRFPLDTFIEDCWTCEVRVKPKASRTAHLRYDAFKIPEDLANQPKTLHLPLGVGTC